MLWTHSAQRFRTSGSSIVTLASNGNHHVSSCPTSTRFRTSTHLLEQSRKSSKPRPAAFSNHIPTPGSPLSRPGIWFAELAYSHAHITSPVPHPTLPILNLTHPSQLPLTPRINTWPSLRVINSLFSPANTASEDHHSLPETSAEITT